MGTMLCWRGANLPAGTIPWKAMSVCGRVAFCGSDGDDNGDAGAGGQPPAGGFPKAFAQVMRLLPRSWRVSGVFFITQSACCLNSKSTTVKYFPESPLAMQRASIEPAAALMS